MPKVDVGADPRHFVAIDILHKFDGEAEEFHRFLVQTLAVPGIAHFVGQERVVLAHVPRCGQILPTQHHVGKLEMLHADEEHGQVGALEVSLRRRVGCDGLIMFSFEGVGVGESDPGRTKAIVEEDRLAKEAACLVPPFLPEVPQPDGVPGHSCIRGFGNEVVGLKKQLGVEGRDVVHAGEVEGQRWAVSFVRG